MSDNGTNDLPEYDALSKLVAMLEHAEFCRSFVSDPRGTLQREAIEPVAYEVVDALAELSYDELRVVGRVGAAIRSALPSTGFFF